MAKGKVVGQIDIIMTSKGVKMVSKDLEKVNKSTKEVEKSTKKATDTQKKSTKVAKDYDKQNKSVFQGNLSSAKSFSKMNQTIGSDSGSSGLVGAYATLAANVFAATAAFNALRNASQVQQLEKGLQVLGRTAGKNLTVMADGFREAAGFAVSYDQALRAISVGSSASFSSTQIEGLAEVAKAAATALGRDVGDAVDRLTRGAAKLEPEILDELGIFVRLDDASAKYAASLGVAGSELTRFQQRQAFANEILEQGRRKFGEVGQEVDASAFDRLAATLADLSRTVLDFLNTVLDPLAGFLAENTVALSGLFLIVTKGIINSALPAINRLGQAAIEASGKAMGLANAQIAKTEREIKAQRGLLAPLKMVKGEYQNLFEKIKAGTATIKEQELAQKKLQLTIQKRQANILKGGLKNLELKRKELAAIELEEQKLRGLIALENKRQMKQGGAAASKAAGQFGRIEGGVLGGLDKDFDQGNFLGGMNKAFKKSNKATGAYINRIKTAGVQTKLFGKFQIPLISKSLPIAGAAFKGFGLTAKIAMKGIFTAIPVIGQFLLVFDLLIIGIKKAIGFLAGFKGEASALTKAMKELDSVTASYAEMVGDSNLKNKDAAQRLIINANATNQLVEATKKAAEQQEKARKEMGLFGHLLTSIGRDFEVVGMKIANFFKPVSTGFTQLGLRIEKWSLQIQTSMAGVFNSLYRVFNALFADEGEEIALITDEDITNANKRIKELERGIIEIADLADRELNNKSIDIFGDMVATSSELSSLVEVLTGGGAAARELQGYLGVANINEFASALDNFKKTGDEGAFNPKTLETLKALTNGVNEEGVAIGNLSAELLTGSKLMGLLGEITERGTQETVTAGKAAEELGLQFQNSGEKINEFFTSFRKKATVGPILSEFKMMRNEVAAIAKGEDGAEALFAAFEQAPASLRRVVDNTISIQEAQKLLNAEEGKTEESKKRIKELQSQIGAARKVELESLEKLTRELYKQQLFDNAKLKSLQQQDKALKKYTKANAAATQFQIEKANAQQGITATRLKNELELAEKSLTIDSQRLIAEGNIDKLSSEQLEIYAQITDKKQEIAENDERAIQAGEKGALIAQQTLALTIMQQKATIAEANAQLKVTKALQAQANAARGVGRGQTSGEQLVAQKEAAKIAVQQAQFELNNLEEKFKLEKLILGARLKAAGVSENEIKEVLAGLDAQLVAQRRVAQAKLTGAESDRDQVGNDRFTGLLGDTAGFKMTGAIDTANTELATVDGAGTQEKMEALMEATAPMREQLEALGPEGEAIASAQSGLLSLVSAFDVISDSGASTADRLAGVGAAIGAMAQIMAASSKAQIAELDNQIKAEMKRDGKSKDSLNKIKGMEKKKEMMERKAFERNKKMQMAQTVVNTAAAITKALTETPFPMSLILAGMYGAMGVAQLGIISKQQFQGGSTTIEKPSTSLQVGKRGSAVDTAKSATGGELNYLRGGSTTGQNLGGAGGSFPGGAMGRRGYANGGDGIMVGERGPEIITPAAPVDITPNFALGGAGSNVNFTINAVDAAGVEDVLMNQRGNIIRMIREAANENGTMFLEEIDTQAYGSSS